MIANSLCRSVVIEPSEEDSIRSIKSVLISYYSVSEKMCDRLPVIRNELPMGVSGSEVAVINNSNIYGEASLALSSSSTCPNCSMNRHPRPFSKINSSTNNNRETEVKSLIKTPTPSMTAINSHNDDCSRSSPPITIRNHRQRRAQEPFSDSVMKHLSRFYSLTRKCLTRKFLFDGDALILIGW